LRKSAKGKNAKLSAFSRGFAKHMGASSLLRSFSSPFPFQSSFLHVYQHGRQSAATDIDAKQRAANECTTAGISSDVIGCLLIVSVVFDASNCSFHAECIVVCLCSLLRFALAGFTV
jgi:hypothetical protein